MRTDVSMQVTRPGQWVHQNQEGHQMGHQPTNRCISSCPHSASHPEVRVSRTVVSLPVIKPDRLKTAKAFAEKAVRMHKVFSIRGPYPVIRAALRARGWVEQRMHLSKRQGRRRQSEESRSSSHDAGDSEEEDDNSDTEREQDPDHDIMSRLVRNEMVYFYWTNRRDDIDTNNLHKDQITNHFAKAGSFATKVGLCLNLRNLHWFDSSDPDSFFPRSYRLGDQAEKHAFIEDYRRTACVSLLKYIVERDEGVEAVGGQKRQRDRQMKTVALSPMINSALSVCQRFLESLEHKDIDVGLDTAQTLTEEQWAEFINSYYLVLHGRAQTESTGQFVTCCKDMLQRMKEVSPQMDIDGIHNIWIIKPGAKSRGRGIKCTRRLDQILRLVNTDPTLIKESKWIVQKYVERPLLVHDTKFDVRQWFLVTDWNPLTVWFYKKCYLRFSTQPYSLDTLDSSVHLCNNSIQKHLRPSQQRHHGLPDDNMWSDDQFRTFLSRQGREAQWETVVVPGMKKAVILVLQTAQDLVESRKNTFELYGADFMLGCDLHPWLLEINISPTMAPSTPVTARLCTAVQEDTLKVVLDRRYDRNANIGDFQLIYKQAAVEVPQYVGVNLLIEGNSIKRSCSLPPLRPRHSSAPKPQITVKDKGPVARKEKPHPVLRSAERHTTNTSTTAPVSVEPPAPTENFPNRSIHLPVSGQSLLWKRKVSKEKLQLSSPKKHRGPSMDCTDH